MRQTDLSDLRGRQADQLCAVSFDRTLMVLELIEAYDGMCMALLGR